MTKRVILLHDGKWDTIDKWIVEGEVQEDAISMVKRMSDGSKYEFAEIWGNQIEEPWFVNWIEGRLTEDEAKEAFDRAWKELARTE